VDERTQDTIAKRDELQALLGCGDADRLLAAAERALVALEFRDADRMIGLSPVEQSLLEELHALVVKALEEATRLGSEAGALGLSQVKLNQGDAAAAVDVLAPLAEAGQPRAAARAAEIVWAARVATRYADALRWLGAARDADRTGAVWYMLALFAFHGLGRSRDHSEAIRLHEEAAARGHADAMFELFAMLWNGAGRPVDQAKAIEWCAKSAEAGNTRAMTNMGSLHATGRGLPKDSARAVQWYSRAAQAGHGQAAATLGCMYALGKEIDRDDTRAREHFARADELGFDWRRMAEAVGLKIADWE
jgi:TPR repeat protein